MTATAAPARRARLLDRAGLVLLAVLAYAPSFLAAPGRVPADTKLYLYLDPGRLLADALWSWDDRQFAGWVPHQTIGYLWPSGPWFWTFEQLGFPDWVAHRAWIGTILLAGGLGARWCARRFGLAGPAVLVVALVYQLSPYVLPYISRTSVLLLPWAGLGWLVALTARAAQRGGWRDPALFALVVATVGGINATAMAMIAPAPLLWLADAAWRKELRWRQAFGVAARIGGLSLLVSCWWLVALWVQGTYGAPVLSYSETLEAVSFTATSSEALRGLGYWLFYVTDPTGPLTTMSLHHQVSTVVLAAGWFLILAGVAGLVTVTWRARRFAVLGLLGAVVLAVGTHPIDDPSPWASPLAASSTSTLTLAIRSSTRAVPLAVLCLALGAGALVSALPAALPAALARRRWPGLLAPVLAAVLALAAVVNLPALRNRQFVDPVLEHPQDVPAAWQAVADALDALPPGARTLQLPGTESAVTRWGQTVDPVLPGLTGRDVVQRDWLPLGSAPAMDLFYALDARFHDRTLDPAAIAPVARLFGADSIVVAGDVAFERFRTARPELTWSVYAARPPGLGTPVTYGVPLVNRPAVPMLDETALSDPRIGTEVPEVALVPVEEPGTTVRAKAGTTLLAGSGDGIVAAAGAGLLTGDELLRPIGSLDDGELAQVAAAADRVVVTDSNRRRARNWRGSRDTDGFLEAPGETALEEDPTDHRLPVFSVVRTDDQTVTDRAGPVTARASAYGSPVAYLPEQRPMLAVDGDPTTAWTVGDRGEVGGERLRLELATAEPIGELRLVQPLDDPNRWITELVVRSEAGEQRVALDESSRTAAGQVVPLGVTSSFVELEVAATNIGDRVQYAGFSGVGFAEVQLDDRPATTEVVRVPTRLGEVPESTALDYVFERWRIDPTDRGRADPERSLDRRFTVPTERALTWTAQVRLAARAPDEVLGPLLGAPAGLTASSRLTGVPVAGPWAALDGDAGTAWVTEFGEATGASITVPLDPAATGGPLTVTVVDDERYSRPLRLAIEADGALRELTAVPADSTRFEGTVPAGAAELVVRVLEAEERSTLDRRTGELVVLPVAVTDVDGPGVPSTASTGSLELGCRTDLLELDGEPLAVRLSGDRAAVLDGAPFSAEPCAENELTLGPGNHLLTTAAADAAGLAVDRVVLRSAGTPTAAAPGEDSGTIGDAPAGTIPVTVLERGRGTRRIEVGPCPAGCWLVSGDGWNTGWRGSVDGERLPPPEPVDGGFNGWWLPASDTTRTVELVWAPQRRIWTGLGISTAAVVACVALAVGRRRRRAGTASDLDPAEPVPAVWRAVPVRRAWWPVAAALVAGGLFIAPVWGVLAAAVTAVGAALRRPRLVGAVGLAVLAVVAAALVLRQRAERYPAGFGWVVNVAWAHRPVLLALVLVAVAALVPEEDRAGVTERIR